MGKTQNRCGHSLKIIKQKISEFMNTSYAVEQQEQLWALQREIPVYEGSKLLGNRCCYVLNPYMNPYQNSDSENAFGRIDTAFNTMVENTGNCYGHIAMHKPAIPPSAEQALKLHPNGESVIESQFQKVFPSMGSNDSLASYVSTDREEEQDLVKELQSHALESYNTINLSDEQREQLRTLGFEVSIGEDNTITLIAPDRDLLMHNYQELRQTHPELPPLTINVVAGLSDDRSFIESYLRCDFLLSAGEEVLHDLYFHVIPTLLRILEKNPDLSYQPTQSKTRELVSHRLECITWAMKNKKPYPHAEALLFALSAAIDTFTAEDHNILINEEYLNDLMFRADLIWRDEGLYGDMIVERFPYFSRNPAVEKTLKAAWATIETAYAAFKASCLT